MKIEMIELQVMGRALRFHTKMDQRFEELYMSIPMKDGVTLWFNRELAYIIPGLFLDSFDYALPEPWAKAHKEETGEWSDGVWTYDKRFTQSIFGDFVPYLALVTLFFHAVREAYEEQKNGGNHI